MCVYRSRLCVGVETGPVCVYRSCFSHLPPSGALLRELREVDRDIWVLLLVFVTAGLNEESVGGHLALGLPRVTFGHPE